MERRNGPVYRSEHAEVTAVNPEVTAGMALTPAYGFIAQAMRPSLPEPARPRWWDDAHRLFTVLGMVAAIAILCGIGLYLVVKAACPCTFGGQPAQPNPAPAVSFNASQYDPVTCGSEEVP